MTNEHGHNSWVFSTKTASPSRPWKVIMSFWYQRAVTDKLTGSEAVGSYTQNNTIIYGSEDANDKDDNDGQVVVEDV